ncbi:Disease resistance protein RGA5 [Sesamum alatum]|uniref:Disease resistance protein RGA5 n=1 Tax=Sesamum alatum TaxID=300844 RepID=A0AAE1XW31_9LAMI|nr:Disease resistance protein RGA5 [Sesamum alatum]
MKQKIVIKLGNGDKRYSSKAMKIAAGVSGVESMTLLGESKDRIMVIGAGIDAVSLTKCMRKKLGSAELISLVAIGDNETEEEKIQAIIQYPKSQVINIPCGALLLM